MSHEWREREREREREKNITRSLFVRSWPRGWQSCTGQEDSNDPQWTTTTANEESRHMRQSTKETEVRWIGHREEGRAYISHSFTLKRKGANCDTATELPLEFTGELSYNMHVKRSQGQVWLNSSGPFFSLFLLSFSPLFLQVNWIQTKGDIAIHPLDPPVFSDLLWGVFLKRVSFTAVTMSWASDSTGFSDTQSSKKPASHFAHKERAKGRGAPERRIFQNPPPRLRLLAWCAERKLTICYTIGTVSLFPVLAIIRLVPYATRDEERRVKSKERREWESEKKKKGKERKREETKKTNAMQTAVMDSLSNPYSCKMKGSEERQKKGWKSEKSS